MDRLTMEIKKLARDSGAGGIGAAAAESYHIAPQGHRPR